MRIRRVRIVLPANRQRFAEHDARLVGNTIAREAMGSIKITDSLNVHSNASNSAQLAQDVVQSIRRSKHNGS